MSTCLFRSPLAFRLEAFLKMRIALGRNVSSESKNLRYIDRFLMAALKPGGTITREMVEGWIKNNEHLSVGTRINRISVLKQFCYYLRHFNPKTYILPSISIPRRFHPAPYIYSSSEIHTLMREAKKIGPPGSLRPKVISTIIGLLYTTGLRISEALKLTLGDIDFKRQVLLIRQTKFKKSRYVPISRCTAKALAVFLRQRRAAGFSTEPTRAVFMSPTGKAYGAARVCAVFLEIARKIGLRGPKGQKGPRLHDFRHTFAVQRLLAWYRQGAILQARLPLLSTYLGHNTVTATGVYLQATAELLEQANKRFRKYSRICNVKEETSHVK